MGYVYDESLWPVVQFRFTGRLNEAEADRYFADTDKIVTGDRPYVCVMDGVDMQIPEMDLVKRQTQWIRAHNADMLRLVRGVALVTPSAVIRGLARAVLHIAPLPIPSAIFAELDEGIAWARERVAAASGRAPGAKRVTRPA